MRFEIKSAISIVLLTGCIACGSGNQKLSQTPPPIQTRQFQEPEFPSIPPNASREQMDQGFQQVVAAFSKQRTADLSRFVSALSTLREQPQLVSSVEAFYDRLPKPEYNQRITTLAIVGEMKRADAIPLLQKVVWTRMPDPQPFREGLTPRDYEEMVIVKAIHGLGYLRTPDADKLLIDVMLRHESRSVKIAAIDSYIWNHNDRKDAAQALYQTLPPDLHKFVERPRFYPGMDRNQFNEQVAAWQKKWGTSNP